jgi:hypothetical protein
MPKSFVPSSDDPERQLMIKTKICQRCVVFGYCYLLVPFPPQLTKWNYYTYYVHSFYRNPQKCATDC